MATTEEAAELLEFRHGVERTETLRSIKTDSDIAADLRAEIAPHILEICKVMEKSLVQGMQISFALNPDTFGRYIPPFVHITKAL